MGSFMKEFMSFMHPHYIFNIILSIIYFILKTTTPICYTLFDDCELELREWELLTFLGCIIVIKNRKQPSYKVYIGTVCMFAKLLSLLLFFRQNPLLGVIYILLCILHLAFLPEPAYGGPDFVTYFRGNSLEEELKRDPRITWLVCFYAAWSPTCVNFAPIFAKMSSQYCLDNLKFGKVDVTRFGNVAEHFKVDGSSWSKQLPTVILFQGGKEVLRRPMIDSKGKVVAKFVWSEEHVTKDFGLNDIYLQCKKNPLKKRKNKQDLEARENGVQAESSTVQDKKND